MNERDERPITSWEMAHDLIVRMEVIAPDWRLFTVQYHADDGRYDVEFFRPVSGGWMRWRALPSDEDITAMLARIAGERAPDAKE